MPTVKSTFSLSVMFTIEEISSMKLASIQRVIMDFNGNLLTRCGKTYRRAFLSWIAGMALSMK